MYVLDYEYSYYSEQSGTKPNLVAKILVTKFGFVPDCLVIFKLILIIDDLVSLVKLPWCEWGNTSLMISQYQFK